MKPKDTEKLLELLKKSGSIDAYLQENEKRIGSVL